jgi:uncharacterized membrane protein YdjX (TVP38/TMEM64 family)
MSFDLTEALIDFLRRWGELNPTSAAILALVFIAGGMSPIPRTFLTLASGAVFGMAALPIIAPATTVGCLLTFLLSRYLFAAPVWRYIQHRPKVVSIMHAIDSEGWKIVALCRIASPIPSTLQSALCGLTRIDAWTYTWATFVFTIPQLVLYSYLGAVGKAALLGENTNLNLGFMIASAVTFVAMILLVTRRLRANMRELDRRYASASGISARSE